MKWGKCEKVSWNIYGFTFSCSSHQTLMHADGICKQTKELFQALKVCWEKKVYFLNAVNIKSKVVEI